MNSRAKKTLHAITAAIVALNLAGCASIVNGGPGRISVNSQPSGAKISVFDAAGATLSTEQTPAVLQLKRGAGYFKSAKYRLVIEKEGFRPAEIEIVGSVNGWYWGNFVFGGLIGLFVVDPLTGSMYRLAPKEIDQVLSAENAAIVKQEGGLVVILREQVPAHLVASLEPIAAQ